jgi:hypothetical protein
VQFSVNTSLLPQQLVTARLLVLLTTCLLLVLLTACLLLVLLTARLLLGLRGGCSSPTATQMQLQVLPNAGLLPQPKPQGLYVSFLLYFVSFLLCLSPLLCFLSLCIFPLFPFLKPEIRD